MYIRNLIITYLSLDIKKYFVAKKRMLKRDLH